MLDLAKTNVPHKTVNLSVLLYEIRENRKYNLDELNTLNFIGIEMVKSIHSGEMKRCVINEFAKEIIVAKKKLR